MADKPDKTDYGKLSQKIMNNSSKILLDNMSLASTVMIRRPEPFAASRSNTLPVDAFGLEPDQLRRLADLKDAGFGPTHLRKMHAEGLI